MFLTLFFLLLVVSTPSTGPTAPQAGRSSKRPRFYTDEELANILQNSDDEFWDLDSGEDTEFLDLHESESSDEGSGSLSPPEVPVSPQQPASPQQPSSASAGYLFTNTCPGQRNIPFTASPGFRVSGAETPIDFFRLIANQNFFSHVIDETNIYGQSLLSKSTARKARIKSWKPLCQVEFEKFLALLYMMGQIKVPEISQYWKKSAIYNFPTFSSVMPRDRFQIILRALHFGRNPQPGDPVPTDPLYKIRPLFDIFHENMQNIYYPKRELSLDESLLLWRGRLYFRQYIPNKRHKYGIKIYLLTQTNGLVLKMHVYTGSQDPEIGGKGHAEKVVKKLLLDFTGVGHAVFMDNFYNSVPLVKDLLDKNTYVTGTLRKSRVGNPQVVINAKVKKGEVFQQFSPDGICVMKYHDKRDIFMISSEHDGSKKTIVVKGRTIEKPHIILDYNAAMCGVDRSDQLAAYYPCERKTLRWSAKLGIHVFHTIINNSYILFTEKYGKKLKLLEFRDQIIEALLTPATAPIVPSPRAGKIHLPTKRGRGNRKRCTICWARGERKDSQFICLDCPGEPGLCFGECFRKHHNY